MIWTTPGNISVEELIQFPEETGSFSYYRVERQNIPVIDVRNAMASHFKVTPSAVVFPALREFSFTAVQYASVRKTGPAQIRGDGYSAHRVRQGSRALRSSDLVGNRFTFHLKQIPEAKVNALTAKFHQIEESGLPNYFGDQRFRSMTQYGFIGKAILKNEPLQALRLYLSESNLNDNENIRVYKDLVKTHWGQWGYLLHQAPRPSNFFSVITYLKDHPHDYEKAVNLIRDQLLAHYMETYQAWIWNQALANYLKNCRGSHFNVDIAGMLAPIPEEYIEHVKDLAIQLPRLTAHYPDYFAEAINSAMSAEGISFEDFNIRLIKRVCLVKRERKAWFSPVNVKVEELDDTAQSVNRSMALSFDLRIRQYASLVVKSALAYLELI